MGSVYEIPTGAVAAQFSKRWFGAPTRPVVSPLTVGTSAIRLVPNNPTRVELVVSALSAGNLFILPAAAGVPSTTNGFQVFGGGGQQVLNLQDDGEMVAWEWLVISDTAGTAAMVLEVLADQL